MMSHKFRFLASFDPDQNVWVLDADDCLHFQRVLRLESGTVIEVFDGKGRWAEGPAHVISKTRITVSPDIEHVEPLEAHQTALAMGAIKVSDFEDILPSLVELGVQKIFIFLQPGVDKKRTHPKAQGRWSRIAIAAAKQAKRSWLPELICLAHLRDLERFLGDYQERFVLDATGDKEPLGSKKSSRMIVLGSEHGLMADEFSQLQNWGFRTQGVGQYILRSRTAAIVAATLLSF